MTIVYFTEFARQARDRAGHLIAAGEDPPVAEHQVPIGVEAKSATLDDRTTFVEISFRAAAHLAVGADPTASTAANTYYSAGAVIYRGVPEKSGLRYSVIAP